MYRCGGVEKLSHTKIRSLFEGSYTNIRPFLKESTNHHSLLLKGRYTYRSPPLKGGDKGEGGLYQMFPPPRRGRKKEGVVYHCERQRSVFPFLRFSVSPCLHVSVKGTVLTSTYSISFSIVSTFALRPGNLSFIADHTIDHLIPK